MTDVFSIAQGNGFYNPPCALEIDTAADVETVESPKSTACPPVAMET